MKKATKIVCIVLAVLLLIPIPLSVNDGGSIQWTAVLYQVIDVHQMNDNVPVGYTDGVIVKVLGFEIINTAGIEWN
ncbi:MAG: hypothetical protein IKU51_02225 [Clostridia bacterium]|nr:hypothetical protein [Clostridia bacterium]